MTSRSVDTDPWGDVQENFNRSKIVIQRLQFFKTLRSWGEKGITLVNKTTNIPKKTTGKKKSKSFLVQRISVAIQRGKQRHFFGTMPSSTEILDEIYYVV